VEAIEIQINNPTAILDEIKNLMRVHCRVSEAVAFENEYPAVHNIYLTIRQQLEIAESK
jgi:hypothetical protein